MKPAIIDRIRKDFPTFQIKYKNESLFMKILGALLFFTNFKNYATTIGYNIYMPSSEWMDENPESSFILLCHEVQHCAQRKKLGMFLFSFLYLFIPIPMFAAAYRKDFELEAYIVQLAVLYQLGALTMAQTQFVKDQFSNSTYFWMWLKNIDFTSIVAGIQSGNYVLPQLQQDMVRIYQGK